MFWKVLGFFGIHPMFRRRGRVSAIRFGKTNAEGDARCWLSWQSLTECECGAEMGLLPKGRAWLHFGDNAVGWEWVFGRMGLGFGLTVDAYGGEHDLSGHLYLPLVRLYWHADRVWPKRFRPAISAWWRRVLGYDSRDIVFDFHHGALWVKLWAPENSWDSKQPKWMDWSFDFADFFLGRNRYSEVTLSSVDGFLHLPEGDYPVQVTMMECRWKRPRWPLARVIRRAKIEPGVPIPIPGKGENSWDCGDDAVYSSTVPADTAEEAGSKFVASILERRERYGGNGWQPPAPTCPA